METEFVEMMKPNGSIEMIASGLKHFGGYC